ncbi:MAG: NUDIX hydrolase [Methanobacteriota archaeon]
MIAVRKTPDEVLTRLRDNLTPVGAAPKLPIDGSVLLPLVAGPAEVEVVLTLRAAHLREHPGQVSFPGGHVHRGEDALAAALREAREEIGLAPDRVELLGQLGDVAGPGFRHIRPHVGLVRGEPEFRPDPLEVEAVFRHPLSEFTAPGAYEGRLLHPEVDSPWAGYSVHIFHLPPRPVWGFTGGLLVQFLELALGWRPRPPRIAKSLDELRVGLP